VELDEDGVEEVGSRQLVLNFHRHQPACIQSSDDYEYNGVLDQVTIVPKIRMAYTATFLMPYLLPLLEPCYH
jgi:hypothetical protein